MLSLYYIYIKKLLIYYQIFYEKSTPNTQQHVSLEVSITLYVEPNSISRVRCSHHVTS